MNLDTVASQGFLPWRPNEDAEDLALWDLYEHPRTGTFSMRDGTEVLYHAVGGLDGQVSVWAYACLDPAEAARLAGVSFGSLDEMEAFVQQFMSEHQLVLALADDLLITVWGVAERTGPMYEIATEFLGHVLTQARGPEYPTLRFQETLAEVVRERAEA